GPPRPGGGGRLPQGERPGGQQPGPAASGDPAPQPGGAGNPPATRMTARGAVVVMFLLFLVGTLAAGWLHLELLAGLSFVAGCALAAFYSRRDTLLTAVVTPPLVFMVALVIAELLTSHE